MEGLTEDYIPSFFNIPKGDGTLGTKGGSVEIPQGEATAAVKQSDKPASPDSIPAPVTYQVIKHLENELGSETPELPQMTLEQIREDAAANQLSYSQQKNVAEVPPEMAQLQPPRRTFSFAGLWHDAADALTYARDYAQNGLNFISTLDAASLEDVASAVSLLVEAADVGLLQPAGTPITAQQMAAQQAFLVKAASQYPQAAQFINQRNKQIQQQNSANAITSTKNVMNTVTQGNNSTSDVAKIVHQAVKAIEKSGDASTLAETIVQTALAETDANVDGAQAAAGCRHGRNCQGGGGSGPQQGG